MARPSGTTTYTYNALDQLTAIDAPGTTQDTTLAYNPRGNLLTETANSLTTTYTWDARQHLIELTGQDFGYDGAAWRQWYRQHRSALAKRFVYG